MALKLRKGAKKVGNFLDKQFVAPSRNYNKQMKIRDNKWRQEAEDLQTGRVRNIK